MPLRQTSNYCATCQRQSLFQKQGPNHLVHGILTLVTVGTWGFFVWGPLSLISAIKGYRCTTCGRKPDDPALPAAGPAPTRVEVRELPPDHPPPGA